MEKQLPPRSITISIVTPALSRDYQCTFPNTGEMMNIELLKLKLSDNSFDNLRFSVNPLFRERADDIETIATFNTLIPNLKKDLNVPSMLELKYEQMQVLRKQYLEVFVPWFEEWMTILSTVPETTKQDDEPAKSSDSMES